MTKKSGQGDKFNKYISVVLAVVIIAAVGVYAYTHLVEKEPATSGSVKSIDIGNIFLRREDVT